MSRPSVSIITPTGRREALLRLQHANIVRQTVQDFEWLILDDSPEPCSFFAGLDDPRIHYEHRPGPRLTIGAKRNLLIERATSDIIIHCDDDDFHAAHFVETMAAPLRAGADVSKFSGFFIYSAPYRALAYWDLMVPQLGLHYCISPAGVTAVNFGAAEPEGLKHAGFGFYIAYRKAVWEKRPFADRNHGEDGVFVMAARDAGFKLHIAADTSYSSLYILRHDNTSQCYPQFMLPDFLLERLFGPEVLAMAGVAPG
jgi:glycosyltransferase involved in cell wall biosynthesis